MKKNRLFIALALMLVAVMAVFTGCNNADKGGYGNAGGSGSEQRKYEIVVTDERLIVYEVDAVLTAENADETVKKVRADLAAAGGYEKGSRTSKNGSYYLTLSVPTKSLTDFLDKLEGVGTVNSCTISSTDITDDYASVEQQKAVLVKQKELLEQQLDLATEVKDKAAIIAELSEIAIKIDGYDTDLKSMKKRAEYSTINLRVYEKDTYTPPSYWDELGEVLFGSTSAAGAFVGFLLKVIAALLPFAIIAAAGYWLVILVIFIVCKIRKRPFDMFKKCKEKREIRYREKILRSQQKAVYLEELRKRTQEEQGADENK